MSRTSLVAQTVKHLSTMWETRVRSPGWEDPLDKEMAIHSRTIAWKIPWIEEPGRLQPMSSQRVRHDLTTKQHQQTTPWALSRFLEVDNSMIIFHLLCIVKVKSEVAQSCPTLWDPMDCSLPGSSVHGIFQAIVLEWIAISFSRGSSQPRDRTQVSHIVDRCFTVWATREVQLKLNQHKTENWSEISI